MQQHGAERYPRARIVRCERRRGAQFALRIVVPAKFAFGESQIVVRDRICGIVRSEAFKIGERRRRIAGAQSDNAPRIQGSRRVGSCCDEVVRCDAGRREVATQQQDGHEIRVRREKARVARDRFSKSRLRGTVIGKPRAREPKVVEGGRPLRFARMQRERPF